MSSGFSGAASGGQLEEKVDLSAETTAKLQQTQQQLQNGGSLNDALTVLFALEKQCRVGNDNASLNKVCKACVEYCYHAKDQTALLTTLQTLATRRSQKTSAIQTIVQTAMPWCVQEPYTPVPVGNDADKKARDDLIMTLRDISDGKIFLERERAQLTRALAAIKEQDGDVAGAASIIQDVHVETYGSMSKKDKVEFILEQMRLTLLKGDYVRAAIVAGKISRKNLQEENMEEYKVRFYTLMAIYHRHEKDAFELAKDYHAIYSTPSILQDEAKWTEALQATVLFLTLSPYGNEQQDMMYRLEKESNLEKLPAFRDIIQLMLKKEIAHYPLPQQDQVESITACKEDDLGPHWHDTLHRRVIQHNIRIVSLYYHRIHGKRLAQLLQLEPDRLESELADMVSDGTVYAKIDRPKDIIRFRAPRNAEVVLTDWAGQVDKLLHLVETTSHLIHKEKMANQWKSMGQEYVI